MRAPFGKARQQHEIDQHERAQEHHDHHRSGGAFAVFEAADRGLVSVDDHRGGCAARTAFGQDPDDVEGVEGRDGRKKRHRRDRGNDQWQGNAAEPVEPRGPVHPGRFIKVLRNGLHGGQQIKRHHWNTDPHVRHDGRHEGGVLVGEEFERPAQNAEPLCHSRNHSELTVVHPSPDEDANGNRDHPRRHDQHAKQGATRHHRVEKHGSQGSDQHFQRYRESHPVEGPRNHFRKAARHELLVVFQPYVFVVRAHARVGEGKPECFKKRIGDDSQHDEGRRHQKQIRKIVGLLSRVRHGAPYATP